MAYTSEPEKFTDKEFKTSIKDEIHQILHNKKDIVNHNFSENYMYYYTEKSYLFVDLAVFYETTKGSKFKFFELKYFGGSRMDITDNQFEFLSKNDKELKQYNDIFRWILTDGREERGRERYYFFDNITAKYARMPGKGTFKNININKLNLPMDWIDLYAEIDRFLDC